MVIDNLSKNSAVLEIGSAQGRDALYLAQLGYSVTAVEKSESGHHQLVKAIEEKKLVVSKQLIRIFLILKSRQTSTHL